ncbi:MAG: HEAT repeat domain-containing protein [Methanoregulaceae archaeon]|jgi:HEAT repeat protein
MEKTFRQLKDKSWPDRWTAVYALQKFGIPAIDYLHKALDDDDKWVRYAAVDALGDMRDKRSVDYLTKLLLDEDQDVRFASAWALGEIGDQKASHALMQTVNSDNGFVKIAAEEALAKLETTGKQSPGTAQTQM